MKTLVINLLFVALLASSCSTATKEERAKTDKEQAAVTENLIAGQRYVFIAEYIAPSSSLRSGDYSVIITKDSIISFLPYRGTAYSVSASIMDGIKFTSTDFDYTTKVTKKGWDVNIKIKDNPEHGYEFSFSITQSGKGTLWVTDNVRQSIAFNGHIERKR